MPAALVPVSAEVGFVVGNYHEVEHARRDDAVTPRADVLLAGCMRLNRSDRYPQIAHARRPTMTTMVAATRTRSRAFLRAGRKGLKPMRWTLTVDS